MLASSVWVCTLQWFEMVVLSTELIQLLLVVCDRLKNMFFMNEENVISLWFISSNEWILGSVTPRSLRLDQQGTLEHLIMKICLQSTFKSALKSWELSWNYPILIVKISALLEWVVFSWRCFTIVLYLSVVREIAQCEQRMTLKEFPVTKDQSS